MQTYECLKGPGYWYLATPYSKYPAGLEAAFQMAAKAAAALVKAGVGVFSPIAHSHPIAIHGEIDAYSHEIWLPSDRPLMDAAKGMLIVTAAGYRESVGIQHEMEVFEAAGKPIMYMGPPL